MKIKKVSLRTISVDFNFVSGCCTKHRSTDRLGGQGLASTLENAVKHEVPQGSKILPHEFRRRLD